MATQRTRLIRRIVMLVLFVVVVYGGVIGFHAFMMHKVQQAMAAKGPPTVTVSTAKAKTATWADRLTAVASLKAVQGTTLTAQTAGTVTGLHFHSGEKVNKGQLLVQLNDNVERAKLQADQARLVNARQELKRQRNLYRRKATSQSQLQSAEAAYSEAEAAIAGDKAALANLQVRAPFDGRLGIRQVSLGQYVSPGTGVVDIHQWNPMHVDFQVPQKDVSRIEKGDAVTLTVDALKDKTFKGKITSLASSLDSGTRNLSAQATVPNPKTVLRPGMYGEVEIDLGSSRKVVTVPRTAIAYNTYGDYVYVVVKGKQGPTAKERIVHTGEIRNGRVAITKGVKAGDEVVIAGQVKLRPGARVKVVASPKAVTHPGGPADNGSGD
ncbi:MAG TPA: efflux RND transporter periplasmic adaptor subunit [Gammaproteobacteria bacterium]|nr:efflux RND transporter periplasmic adaptor subunit [Gammaproteobacteria bacterium]